MNAMQHARISAKRWGGEAEDYYEVHSFIDSTKSLCSDARHRILHTLWGVNSVVVPIYGHSLLNSAGKSVDLKDLCERDHLLVDYQQRFIPTLADFVRAIDPARYLRGSNKKLKKYTSIIQINRNFHKYCYRP